MAEELKTCSVVDCNRRTEALGWCSMHYMRMRRTGYLGIKTIDRGRALEWIGDHTQHEGEECLIWPFRRSGVGYGYLSHRGLAAPAHRVMCILAHGEPDATGVQAAHSCGKGHEGCVNPRHIRWATVTENMRDKVVHETQTRGADHPVTKLSEADVKAIRALDGRETDGNVAKLFGVSAGHISSIRRGKAWGWLE